MKYIERERVRAVAAREKLFRDGGFGEFFGKQRDFVLNEPELNLWAGIREDALDYFAANKISWWKGSEDQPTGHLLSSQIACINHLYPLRQRADAATAALQAIDADVTGVSNIDDGYVAFEYIGSNQVLAERAFTRGANCTSVDAAMIGKTASGERRLYLIEWKYVESYKSRDDKYTPARSAIYDHHMGHPESPIRISDPRCLYFEPFYQLMRQTLLGWLLIRTGERGCDAWRHVHVAPAENEDLLAVTSPDLGGETVYEAWRNVLVNPQHFITTTPQKLIAATSACPDTLAHRRYLEARYWPEG